MAFDGPEDPYARLLGERTELNFNLQPAEAGATDWAVRLEGDAARAALDGRWGGKRLGVQGEASVAWSPQALRAWTAAAASTAQRVELVQKPPEGGTRARPAWRAARLRCLAWGAP